MAAFEEAYRQLYSRAIPGVDVEILSWVTVVEAPIEASIETPARTQAGSPMPISRRKVFDPAVGEFQDVPFYRRETMKPGWTVTGPAVIEEDETSTVVSPAFDAMVNGYGYIELTRREG